MLISFDSEAKALYVQIKDKKVKRTIEFAPEVFVDLDSDGELVGVEMLRPGKLQIFQKIARKFQIPALGHIPKEYIPKAFAHV